MQFVFITRLHFSYTKIKHVSFEKKSGKGKKQIILNRITFFYYQNMKLIFYVFMNFAKWLMFSYYAFSCFHSDKNGFNFFRLVIVDEWDVWQYLPRQFNLIYVAINHTLGKKLISSWKCDVHGKGLKLAEKICTYLILLDPSEELLFRIYFPNKLRI